MYHVSFELPGCVGMAEVEDSVRTSSIGVTGASKLLCGCREPEQGPLQEYQVHFTTEPSLRAQR